MPWTMEGMRQVQLLSYWAAKKIYIKQESHTISPLVSQIKCAQFVLTV